MRAPSDGTAVENAAQLKGREVSQQVGNGEGGREGGGEGRLAMADGKEGRME